MSSTSSLEFVGFGLHADVVKLRAPVSRALKNINFTATVRDGKLVQTGRMPEPNRVEIVVEKDGSVFLFRFAEGDVFAGDTHHETIDRAKYQAKCEYGIEDSEWVKSGD